MPDFIEVSIVPNDTGLINVTIIECEPVVRVNTISSDGIFIWTYTTTLLQAFTKIVADYAHISLCNKICCCEFIDLLCKRESFVYDTKSNLIELRLCLCVSKLRASIHSIDKRCAYEGIYWYEDMAVATCVPKSFSTYEWQKLREELAVKFAGRLTAITGVNPLMYVTCTYNGKQITQTMSTCKPPKIDIHYQHTFITNGSAEKDTEVYVEWLRTVCNVYEWQKLREELAVRRNLWEIH